MLAARSHLCPRAFQDLAEIAWWIVLSQANYSDPLFSGGLGVWGGGVGEGFLSFPTTLLSLSFLQTRGHVSFSSLACPLAPQNCLAPLADLDDLLQGPQDSLRLIAFEISRVIRSPLQSTCLDSFFRFQDRRDGRSQAFPFLRSIAVFPVRITGLLLRFWTAKPVEALDVRTGCSNFFRRVPPYSRAEASSGCSFSWNDVVSQQNFSPRGELLLPSPVESSSPFAVHQFSFALLT